MIPHSFNADVIMQTKDQFGRLSYPQTTKNCFLTAWVGTLCSHLGNKTVPGILSINDVSRTLKEVSGSFAQMLFGDVLTLTGIQVGTRNDPVSLTNNKLLGLITRGVGVGQLLYSHNQTSNFESDDSQAFYYISREFVNQSGASVIVKEIGLCIIIRCVEVTIDNFLADRTVPASSIPIPNGQSLYITYKIRNVIQ